MITNVVDSFTRGVKPWNQKKKRIPRRDGIQKTRRTMWTRGHTRSIKTNSSNEPISLRSTLGSIYLSIYLPCVDLGGPLRSGPSNAGIHFLSTPLLSLSLSSSPFFFPLGGPETRNTEMCTRGRHVNNHGRMARLNSAEPCRSLTRHRRVSGRRSRSLKRGWRRNWGSSRGTVGEEGGGWWWGEREAENETARRRRGRKDRRKWCDKGKKLRGEREEDLKRRCAHKVLRSVWASGMNEMGKGGRGFVVGGGESERRGRMDEILLLDGAWRKNGKDEK